MKLFWVTWFLLIAAALHLIGDIHYILADLGKLHDLTEAATDQSVRIQEVWGAALVRIGASGFYFSAAAMVELLHRIWRRLDAGAPASLEGDQRDRG